jgi:hypothetical protein
MSDLLLNFEEKVEEINQYFDLVYFLGDKPHIDDFRLQTELQSTLKANCYLLLYNLIESSVVEGLNFIFEDINQQKISFENFNDSYKKLWLEYSYQLVTKAKVENNKNISKNLSLILNDLSIFEILKYRESKKLDGNEVEFIFENYKGYLKILGISSEVSGNIDTQQIEKLAKKYGFKAPKRTNGRDLVKIKEFRNKLAHGEETFADVGWQESIPELIEIKNRITSYLRSLLENINYFVDNKQYLKLAN